VPEALKETMSGSFGDPEQQALLEAQTKYNIETYGYGNWYDFCVSEWGTKWDVDCDGTISLSNDGLTVEASFDSAWSPPIGVYAHMLEQGYSVTAYYYESGMAYVGKWDNGYDDCYELGSETTNTVRSVIGDELDDYFGISESMSEYEEDEELTEWIKDGVEARKESTE
jgi:hypothetical protein